MNLGMNFQSASKRMWYMLHPLDRHLHSPKCKQGDGNAKITSLAKEFEHNKPDGVVLIAGDFK